MRAKTTSGIVILERYQNPPPKTLFFTQLLAHRAVSRGESGQKQGSEKANHTAESSAIGTARYRRLGAEPQSLPEEPALVRITV